MIELAADYAALGLAPGASPEEVKRAWRALARRTHPDLNPDDPDAAKRFTAVQAAYERILDPARVGSVPRRGEPDADWFDGCAWMAEAHFAHLRQDVLPRYATQHRAGPSVVTALAAAVDVGLGARAPDVVVVRLARLWVRRVLRHTNVVVDDGPPQGYGTVGILNIRGRTTIVLWPRVLWAEGLRDDDAVRPRIQRDVELAVAAAAPHLLGVVLPIQPGADREWWINQLFWPVVFTIVLALSAVMLETAWLHAVHRL